MRSFSGVMIPSLAISSIDQLADEGSVVGFGTPAAEAKPNWKKERALRVPMVPRPSIHRFMMSGIIALTAAIRLRLNCEPGSSLDC